jgi:hypothetical protein
MFVEVRYKTEIRDADVYECGLVVESDGRLQFWRGKDDYESKFMSIALDQIALWTIVDSPEAVKTPEPDDVVRIYVPKDTYQRLFRSQYEVGILSRVDAFYVDLPIYYVREFEFSYRLMEDRQRGSHG